MTTDISKIPGLRELWNETLGDPRIIIAVLDGPVDLQHSTLLSASLSLINTLSPNEIDHDLASSHGTHVTSVIFGSHNSPVKGVAPSCKGMILPIFKKGPNGSVEHCSQLDLARAITQAVDLGANVINVSGGQFLSPSSAYPILTETVKKCVREGVLIIAATGNEGCECSHIPAALPSVLAVGAMDMNGIPLKFSNWGQAYLSQGILAPGKDILGASPRGGISLMSGTSFATPIVSGIVGLLLSLQLKLGQEPDPYGIKEMLLNTTIPCNYYQETNCQRFLAGQMNILGALSLIKNGEKKMSEQNNYEVSIRTNASEKDKGLPSYLIETSHTSQTQPEVKDTIYPSACNCNNQNSCSCSNRKSLQQVYALGQLDYDLVSEARRDSIQQHMSSINQKASPYTPKQLLEYLGANPWDSSSITWTLNLDTTPIYAISPQGAFAKDAYSRLQEFLREQIEEGVERVSIPGYISGKTQLITGQVIPVIVPEIRGMYSWTTSELLKSICGENPSEETEHAQHEQFIKKMEGVKNFLERVYHEIRNLGISSQDRAINYAATNAFTIEKVYETAINEEMELDSIGVERSPICRPHSDCWDVKLHFFFPQRQVQTVRKVYRFTVDVSDVVPVTVGPVRSWFIR